ncbi:sensor histidine kinase [Pontiella sp.]|uniref:sensor histidine kinase n=1 Tax=Pontiella sp. TaxID=2837462 RepID=UPI003568386A
MSCLLSTLCHAAPQRPAAAAYSPQKRTLAELEKRLAEIDSELSRTARFTPRNGAGSIGWFSASRENPTHAEWAEINCDGNMPIDRIVLVPTLWNDADEGPQADGFPEAFEVIAGQEGEREGTVVARFGPEDRLLPRVAPLVVDVAPTPADWVRVKAVQLSRSARNGRHTFSLAEIMVFSGDRNIALAQPMRVSSTTTGWNAEATAPETLTDGFTPFLMNAGHGNKSQPYLARFPAKRIFRLTIDLENSCRVDEIRLHSAADIRKHIPLPQQVDYGIPMHFTVVGANAADFSDAQCLVDYRRNSIYDTGSILLRNVPETRCRYIRFVVDEPYQAPEMPDNRRYVNLSELEVISKGANVARGKQATFPSVRDSLHEFTESITDGNNSFGTILTIRDWMGQLARRHDLERERPVVFAELNQRYARQKKHLWALYWAVGILAVGIAFTILVDRIFRMRYVARIKQRFAADLHDELGANLHSIGLISDVAQHAQTREQWQALGQRIRELTERSGTAVRHCTNLLEADDLYIGLTTDMRRSAERIATNLKHDFTTEGEPFLEQLKPRMRIDLFLFYKECLVNICRHSGATQIRTHLTGGEKDILLTVSDNGKGLGGNIPSSLKRRARLLRAKLSVESPAEGGTRIGLRLRNRRSVASAIRLKLNALRPSTQRNRE